MPAFSRVWQIGEGVQGEGYKTVAKKKKKSQHCGQFYYYNRCNLIAKVECNFLFLLWEYVHSHFYLWMVMRGR